jgi:hypothetical protein
VESQSSEAPAEINDANAAGRKGPFDIRHLFNGLVDSYLYHSAA